jgi:hypothetical protein
VARKRRAAQLPGHQHAQESRDLGQRCVKTTPLLLLLLLRGQQRRLEVFVNAPSPLSLRAPGLNKLE